VSGAGTTGLRWILRSQSGLRAGWSLLLFVLVAVAIAIAVQYAAAPFAPAPAPDGAWRPLTLAFGDVMTLLIAAIALAVVARVEGGTWSRYFLGGAGAGKLTGEGALWGTLAVAGIVLPLAAFGAYTVSGLALAPAEAATFALLWLAPSVLGSLFEEVTFRGFALSTLTRGIGFWPAALTLSAFFGGVHWLTKPMETWVDGLSTGLLSLFMCVATRRTGSIWFAVGFHAAFNYVALFVLGSPNTGSAGLPVHGHLLDADFHGPVWLTGGPMGLEASAFVFVVLTGLFIGIARRRSAKTARTGGPAT